MREFIIPTEIPEEIEFYEEHKCEELVRCKDCKYNDDGECIIKSGWFPVKPDWFCADGERNDSKI